jgi:hypothetical protein
MVVKWRPPRTAKTTVDAGEPVDVRQDGEREFPWVVRFLVVARLGAAARKGWAPSAPQLAIRWVRRR